MSQTRDRFITASKFAQIMAKMDGLEAPTSDRPHGRRGDARRRARRRPVVLGMTLAVVMGAQGAPQDACR